MTVAVRVSGWVWRMSRCCSSPRRNEYAGDEWGHDTCQRSARHGQVRHAAKWTGITVALWCGCRTRFGPGGRCSPPGAAAARDRRGAYGWCPEGVPVHAVGRGDVRCHAAAGFGLGCRATNGSAPVRRQHGFVALPGWRRTGPGMLWDHDARPDTLRGRRCCGYAGGPVGACFWLVWVCRFLEGIR